MDDELQRLRRHARLGGELEVAELARCLALHGLWEVWTITNIVFSRSNILNGTPHRVEATTEHGDRRRATFYTEDTLYDELLPAALGRDVHPSELEDRREDDLDDIDADDSNLIAHEMLDTVVRALPRVEDSGRVRWTFQSLEGGSFRLLRR